MSDADFYDPLDKGVPTEKTGEACPICPSGELVKPRSELPQCPRCHYVQNSVHGDPVLRDFPVTHRQGRHLLDAFGYDTHGTPGDIGTRLRRFASEHDMTTADLRHLLGDLTNAEGYNSGADADLLADALFETLAALTDLRERLAGGAQRSGVPAEDVVESVWRAYDLEAASETYADSGHERADRSSPEEFAVTDLEGDDE